MEIDSDHYLVKSKIRIPKKYIKKKAAQVGNNETRWKIQLLEDPSIRRLYQQRLDEQIRGRSGDVNKDWDKLKMAVKNVANEVLGMQSKRKPNRMKFWNEELEEEIKEKKRLYKK